MRTSRLTVGMCVATIAILAGAATQASAVSISPGAYTMTGIVGTYTYGQTDLNYGVPVANVADLGLVEGMMSDGYHSPVNGGENEYPSDIGIYNFPAAGLHALEFAMNGGQDYNLDSLSFISTRSFSDATPIQVDMALDGGGWVLAAATTSGALGIVTGTDAVYTIALGGVQADRFRLTTGGGGQLSIHEIIVGGEIITPDDPGDPGVIPEPLTVVAVLGSMGGLCGYLRKRRVA